MGVASTRWLRLLALTAPLLGAALLGASCAGKERLAIVLDAAAESAPDTGSREEVVQPTDGGPADAPSDSWAPPADAADATVDLDASSDGSVDAAPPTGGPCLPDGGCPAPFQCFYPLAPSHAGCANSAAAGFCGSLADAMACRGGFFGIACGCDGGGVFSGVCGPEYIPPYARDAGVCYIGACYFELQPSYPVVSTGTGSCAVDASAD